MLEGTKSTVVESSRTPFVDFQYSTMEHRRHANDVTNHIWSTNLLLLVRLFLLYHCLCWSLSTNSSLINHIFLQFCFRPFQGTKYRNDVFAEKKSQGTHPIDAMDVASTGVEFLSQFRSPRHHLSERTHVTINQLPQRPPALHWFCVTRGGTAHICTCC